MLQFIASNINSISAIIAVLFVVGVMGSCFCAIKPYCDEYADTLATVAL